MPGGFNTWEQLEMCYVYQTWIYLWSSVFKYTNENEKKFRLNQLVLVLQKL